MSKFSFRAFLLLVAMLVSQSVSLFAVVIYREVTIGSNIYDLRDGQEATVIGAVSDTTELVIPPYVDYLGKTYTVTEVSIDQFSELVPRSVKSITLPSTVKQMNGYWYSMQNLNAVHISDMSAFCRIKHKSDNYVYGYNLLSIAKNLYLNGELVVNAVIPEDITEIEGGMFTGAECIESFTFLGPVKKIGWNGIMCPNLKYIDFQDLESWCQLDYYTNVEIDDFENYKLSKSDLESRGRVFALFIRFPDLELRYKGEPFHDLILPESITSIPTGIFSGYKGLRSVTLPDKPVEISMQAFDGCINLKEVHFASYNTLFSGKSGDVGRYADMLVVGGELVDHLDIPEGTEILDNAYLSYLPVSSVSLPESLTNIEDKTFVGCRNLHHIDIPEGVKCGNEVFRGSGITEIKASRYFPGWIPANAFRDCRNLVKVEIDKDLYKIGSMAFSGCTSLRSLTFPPVGLSPDASGGSGSLDANYTAIKNCPSLEFLNTGNYMKDFNFDLNKTLNLKTIVFGEKIENIETSGNYGSSNAFCNLTDIWVMAPLPPKVNEKTHQVFTDINYENTVLHVRKGAHLTYQYAPVWKNFRLIEVFSELPPDISSVDGIESESDALPFKIEDGRIIPADGESIMRVYNISGQLLHQGYGVSPKLPAGVYIIVLDGQSCKIAIQ